MKNKKLLIGIITGIIIIIIIIISIIVITNKKGQNSINDDNKYTEVEIEEIEEIEAKIDWSKLNFTINNIEYSYSWKISDFVNNGWTSQSKEDEKKLNETLNNDYLKSIIPNYTDDNYNNLGYDNVNLKQNNLEASLYFDLKNINSKIIDINVSELKLKPINKNINNFDFYGLKFSSTKEDILELFGNKNYEISSDNENEYYKYHRLLEDNNTAGLEIILNKKDNRIKEITISIF